MYITTIINLYISLQKLCVCLETSYRVLDQRQKLVTALIKQTTANWSSAENMVVSKSFIFIALNSNFSLIRVCTGHDQVIQFRVECVASFVACLLYGCRNRCRFGKEEDACPFLPYVAIFSPCLAMLSCVASRGLILTNLML